MLTTDIHVSKLLSNSRGPMKITWPPVEVAMPALGQSGRSADADAGFSHMMWADDKEVENKQ